MAAANSKDSPFFDANLMSVWKERAKKYGARCVIDLAHPAHSYDAITEQQKKILLPRLAGLLIGGERTVLDFGCGPGRFSTALAELLRDAEVIGYDICQELLDIAPPAPYVRYMSSASELASDSFKGYFDVIWICLVIGGIPDGRCFRIAEHLMENLKDGGLLFLVEHTSDVKPGSEFWKFRPLIAYQRMFPLVDLRKIASYFDFGEEIAVLAGRKLVPLSP